MSQNGNILMYLQEGNTLTKREAYHLFGSLSLNSRVAEIRRKTGAQIDCERVEIGGRVSFRYSMPVKVAYG